jgi:uncharacterized protein YqfB (UPF0267 family)
MATLPKIVAVDFDGTLVEDCYPEIGPVKQEIFDMMNAYKALGWKVVLWTCRDKEQLLSAVVFCARNGLTFDAVNENVKEAQAMFNNDTRKVFANVYIDDKLHWVEGVNKIASGDIHNRQHSQVS